MRKLLATAAFLLVSTAAQAQYSFEYGGRTIRIDPDRGTVQIPGVYDNTNQGKAKKAKKGETKPDQPAPQQAKVDPQPPAAVPAPAPVVAPPPAELAPAAAAPPPAPLPPPAPPPTTAATSAPAETAVLPPPAPAAIEPPAASAVVAPPAPTVAAAPPAPPPPAPPPAPAPVQAAAVAPPAPAAAAPARDPNSPLGVWLTEEKEGKVRIEQCGSNLCGYSVDSKSNQNGEQVLINMKPGKDQKDQKWSGRILDPNTGSTYDSTIALKGTDRLRVQGCAFGGMFCGGQTWTRVN
ncbi:hypothetical protein PMI42_00277 [Bradyrhizobium sp. YR681]|uniref:DUF2147 domain-containing protein n=1 Tax=Bradyrhizobium sp. YR681 TaxID=1144344 RepID=UPI0002710C25|nr:DUF2147 domain-containing protein [Bradyrhizobium sp. YR681]EJN16179.1 hypothetical protein PMI42_00277 [Bradyrhizobium sp. YR681]